MFSSKTENFQTCFHREINPAVLTLSPFSHKNSRDSQDLSSPNMFLSKTENIQTCFHRENDPSCWHGVKHPSLTPSIHFDKLFCLAVVTFPAKDDKVMLASLASFVAH